MADNYLGSQSSLWIQLNGPNTAPAYLGCHSVGDVDEPQGDKTLLYCPDPAAAGKFKVKNSFRGEPGAITNSIETDLRKTADYLEDLGLCGVPIYVHKMFGGRRDTFTNFDRSFVFYPASITSRSLSNLSVRSGADEAETLQGFEISSDAFYRMFNLEASRISIVETENVNNLAVCGEERCEGDTGPAQKIEDYIFAVCDADGGYSANVLASIEGAAFTATASDPFGSNEHIHGVVCFRVGRDTIRVLVARGSTDAGNPAEVAYSDDLGVTWTTVNVGAVNGEFVSNGHALVALDRYHIWLGTNGGRIYFSNDGGATWTLQEAAVISATAIAALSFVDPNVGFALWASGIVARSTDDSSASATWSARTSVGVAGQMDLQANSAFFLYAVGTNGRYYSHDGADSWSLRDAVATAAIDFWGDLLTISVGSAVSGAIKESINGGYDWTDAPTVANQGFLDVLLVSAKLGYIAGKTDSGTGFIAKILPAI